MDQIISKQKYDYNTLQKLLVTTYFEMNMNN